MNEWIKTRLWPVTMITLTLGFVLAPVQENWAKKPKDSFPLSYYPMFSAVRGDSYSSSSLVGWTREGERRVVPYHFAGSGGFNEVRHQVRHRIQDRKANELCRKVARRVARSSRSEMQGIERLQVVTVTHNLDSYFHGDKQPLKEKVHASCPVETPKKEVEK